MSLMRIRMELARTPEFPGGSSAHGYEFVAPLSKDDHIDAEEWRANKDQCEVVRFWGDEEEERGKLRHVGQGWRFDYKKGDEDDEPFFKLDRHSLRLGNYVTVTERDGEQMPFRIVSILPM